MKILITSGGTFEKIDSVRKITNMASGRLGALIADEFAKCGESSPQIFYVCGESAIKPTASGVDIIEISSVKDLLYELTVLFEKHKFDAVIHAMAVSDYTVQKVIQPDGTGYESSEITSENLRENKISSELDELIIVMKKTPKIIRMIKTVQPDTVLVGFKLLSGVTDDELRLAGYNLLVKNNCDFVLANDLTQIEGANHRGLLIAPDSNYTSFSTKQEIACGIVSSVLKSIQN